MASNTNVTTGTVRLSYARLFTPKANDQGKDVWSTLLLIPKTDTKTVAALTAAAEAALEIGVQKGIFKKGTALKNAWSTLKDGDEHEDVEDAPEYAGHFYMNVNAYNRAPVVVDRQNRPLRETDVYSGCYARVSINSAPFKVPTNKGITFYLNGVQKIDDGEPLDGSLTVDAMFGEVEEDDELV